MLLVLQCSLDVSQLLHLLMWMLWTALYATMVAFVLSGLARRLTKTANILRYSIRNSTRQHPIPSIPNPNHISEQSINLDTTHNTGSDNVHNNNNTNTLHVPTQIARDDNQNNSAALDGATNTNTAIQQISNDITNDNNANTLSNETNTLERLGSRISYMLPYIWYMRYQLFVSFMFVLVVWIILQIVTYFVNLIFGSASLNWVSSLTSELLDFIVFAGIIYTSNMSSRLFTISSRHNTVLYDHHHHQQYIPLRTIHSPLNSHVDDRDSSEDLHTHPTSHAENVAHLEPNHDITTITNTNNIN
jgi:hypothetical protein